ncbi:alpha/beta hydrolase [Croceibacterium sp. LX-88]|uniref:Alpha/beta hydrolase n=1 Tax=Croceibacterium selenioxidans TaxID=2838833 RepID=A0ABS5W470_9SPHN|nr:alpha/beta hydrolase [Croceibacterium selenioxidans]
MRRSGASGDDLLKSNHWREAGVSQVTNLTTKLFDRRAIPPGAIESRWTAPDGHLIRRIDWSEPSKARGSLLFMPGRGDAYEKYLEVLDHWHGQGWRVTAADWRGQAGSGRFGLDEVTGHISEFTEWTADLSAFWREWAEGRKAPLVLVGHSMGGHLALRAVAERGLVPAAAALILSAPMLDVPPEVLPLALKHAFARFMASLGDARRPAWKWSEKPGELPEGRQALLTHHDERYADELWWRHERPELVMATGSWGWVAGALASIRWLNRPGALEAIDLPVYIVATRADRLVGSRAIHQAAKRLPRARTLWFGPEAGHEILRESDAVRQRALAGIDAFLEEVLPT